MEVPTRRAWPSVIPVFLGNQPALFAVTRGTSAEQKRGDEDKTGDGFHGGSGSTVARHFLHSFPLVQAPKNRSIGSPFRNPVLGDELNASAASPRPACFLGSRRRRKPDRIWISAGKPWWPARRPPGTPRIGRGPGRGTWIRCSVLAYSKWVSAVPAW